MVALPELSVLVAYRTNVTLSGAAPAEGGYTPANGEPILLTAQTDNTKNGPYTVNTAGAWSRHTEFDTSAEFVPGFRVHVRKGSTDNKGYWYFANEETPTLETSALNFYKMTEVRPVVVGPRLEKRYLSSGPEIRILPVANLTPGTYSFPNIGVTAEGTVSFIEPGALFETMKEGLGVEWAAANSLTVGEGSAWIEGLGRVVTYAGGTVTPNPAAAGFVYLYLYESGVAGSGVGSIEVSTVAPAAPYRGNARSKSTDNTRRLIKTVRATAANTIMRFRPGPGGLHMHLGAWDTAVASGGLKIHDLARISATNNTPLDTDLSPLVPPHCRVAEVQGRIVLVSAFTTAWFRHSENTTKVRFAGSPGTNAASTPFTMLVETDSNRHIEAVQDAGAAADIILACTGFVEEVA